MKKPILGLGIAITLTLAASPSFATGPSSSPPSHISGVCKVFPAPWCDPFDKPNPGRDFPPTGPTPHAVPEIDAANAGLALALVGGLLAIRRERRKRR